MEGERGKISFNTVLAEEDFCLPRRWQKIGFVQDHVLDLQE